MYVTLQYIPLISVSFSDIINNGSQQLIFLTGHLTLGLMCLFQVSLGESEGPARCGGGELAVSYHYTQHLG